METNNNKLLEFIDSMADLLHEVTRPLYRKRSEYPIDENALYAPPLHPGEPFCPPKLKQLLAKFEHLEPHPVS